MRLVKLYTIHGAMWIDADQLTGPRTILTIYTRKGNRLSQVAKTALERERASFGVHRDNLFASMEHANAHFDRIHADMAQRGQSVKLDTLTH